MNEQEFKEIFAVFILSHKRSENVKTARMLKDQGYTGDWFIVIDDEDDEADNYRKNTETKSSSSAKRMKLPSQIPVTPKMTEDAAFLPGIRFRKLPEKWDTKSIYSWMMISAVLIFGIRWERSCNAKSAAIWISCL